MKKLLLFLIVGFLAFNSSEMMLKNDVVSLILNGVSNIETFFRGSAIPIDNLCLSYYKSLANISSKFIECVANNSRPFHVCQNCLIYYLKFNQIHTLIKNDVDVYATSLYKDGLTCMDIIEATDRVQIALKISNTVNDVWSNSMCDDCFEFYDMVNETVNFSLKYDVQKFFDIQQNLELCIYNFTKKPSSIDPLFQNYSSNSTLCKTCKEDYVMLTKHFANMSTQNDENNMCMDVVDLFNYTRIAWSKGYQCNYRDIDQTNVIIISGLFSVLTVIFYLVARLSGHVEEKKFAKISRKKSYSSINQRDF